MVSSVVLQRLRCININMNFLFIYKSINSCVCARACVCVCEKERERVWKQLGFTPDCLSSSCFFHRRLIQGRLSIGSHFTPAFGLAPKTARLVYFADCYLVIALLTDCLMLKTSVIIYFSVALTLSFRLLTYAIYVAFLLFLVWFKTQLHILFLKSTN